MARQGAIIVLSLAALSDLGEGARPVKLYARQEKNTSLLQSQPKRTPTTWSLSALNTVCHDPTTCGPGKAQHPLLDGCSGGGLYSYFGSPRLAFHDEKAGEAICCDEAGQATRNINGDHPVWNTHNNGSRKLSHQDCTTPNTTRVTNNNYGSPSYTYGEAKEICEGVGLRLCHSQAELDTSCGTGCHFNAALAWIDDTEVKHHSLLDGCSRSGDLYPGWGEPRPGYHAETLGEAICCNTEGQATRNVIKDDRPLYNTDTDGKRILSHENCTTPSSNRVTNSDTPSHTYDEAKAICEGVGLRLCQNQEELDTSCGTGCHFNAVLAWVADEGRHGRCRDFGCSGCSAGKCDTASEAQLCCEEKAGCSAVYGGGDHWWTFNAPCVEEEHDNYYEVFHRPGA